MRALALVLAAFVAAAATEARRPRASILRPHWPASSKVSHRARSVPGVARDRHGKIRRSEAARHAFRQKNRCPSTGRTRGRCPGYEIDHHVPLSKGGDDRPDNMQWLSTPQHKAKHRAQSP
jgi:hypothetical protein